MQYFFLLYANFSKSGNTHFMFEKEIRYLIPQPMPVILCVGSDKISGDSVGPLVGELLVNRFNLRCFVYGVSGRSVNGKNLPEYIEFISRVHPDSPIIAVDACVSNCIPVGSIKVIGGGITPRRAVTNTANSVGDLGILGVVEKPSKDTLNTLMSVPLDNVLKISFKIAFMLYCALTPKPASFVL